MHTIPIGLAIVIIAVLVYWHGGDYAPYAAGALAVAGGALICYGATTEEFRNKVVYSGLFGHRRRKGDFRWTELKQANLANFDFVARYWFDVVQNCTIVDQCEPAWLNEPEEYGPSKKELTAMVRDYYLPSIHSEKLEGADNQAERWMEVLDVYRDIKEGFREEIKRLAWAHRGREEHMKILNEYANTVDDYRAKKKDLKWSLDSKLTLMVMYGGVNRQIVMPEVQALRDELRELKANMKILTEQVIGVVSIPGASQMQKAYELLQDCKRITHVYKKLRSKLIEFALPILIGQFKDYMAVPRYRDFTWREMHSYAVAYMKNMRYAAELAETPVAPTLITIYRDRVEKMMAMARRARPAGSTMAGR